MKIYEIVDGEEKLLIGCLLYFEKEKSFIIELLDSLDEWTAPLLFTSQVKSGKYTIGRDHSRLWINERVIPATRQNIGSILANSNIPAYDEMKLLEKSKGRCSHDNMYIRRITDIPHYVQKRMERNLSECVISDDGYMLCFFNDGTAKKINMEELNCLPFINKIISNKALLKSGHLAANGYCVTFNDSMDVGAGFLYDKGFEISVSLKDFLLFAKENLVDSSQCCNILDCSRQNLVNYLSKDQLIPLKKDIKGNLYTKGNIYKILA